jgi:hypothetical protein
VSLREQVVILFYPFTIGEHQGYFSLTALEGENQVILARIIIHKSLLMTSGFMLEIFFSLLLVRTPEEYLHGKVAAVPVLEEHNTVCAFSHAMALSCRVGQHLPEFSLDTLLGFLSVSLGLAQLLHSANSYHASHLTTLSYRDLRVRVHFVEKLNLLLILY